jgi:hypothetical protein
MVMDERVAEAFTAPGDQVDRLMTGSVYCPVCPPGLADRPSAATGTAMRPATLARYPGEAGYRDVGIPPIAHDFCRFYRLHP